MKKFYKDILVGGIASALGTLLYALVLAVGSFLIGAFSVSSTYVAIRIIIIVFASIITGVAIYVFQAKTRSRQKKSRYSNRTRTIWGSGALIVNCLVIWFLFFVPSTYIIPPLEINIINTSHNEIVISERADFLLLVNARISMGTTIGSGQMDLHTIDGSLQDVITIPAGSSKPLVGEFRNPLQYLSLLENGNSDIEVHIFESPYGV